MGTFYLHIGLHKTATSTLQKHVFPFLAQTLFLRRDTTNRDSLYFRICGYCFSPGRPVDSSVLRHDILMALKSSNLLLSEEWFTSDYCGQYGWESPPWQEKLERLASLVDNCNLSLLSTIRSPLTALYSYYATMNKVGILERYASFADFIEHSNDALAYDFYYLDATVRACFVQECQYLKFETLESKPAVFFDELSAWLCLQDHLSPVEKHENRTVSFGGLRVVSRSKPLAPEQATSPAGDTVRPWWKEKLMTKFSPPKMMLTQKPSKQDIDRIRSKFQATIELFTDT